MATGVAVGTAIVGGGLEIYGGIQQGRAQERAANEQAAAQRRRAKELLRRTDLELLDLERETDDFSAEQMLQLASNNVSLNTTSSYQILADTYRKSAEERLRKIDEARFQAQELETGALSSIEQGKSFRRAGTLNAIGAGVSLFSDVYGAFEGD
jgi:hypothetical protein